VAEEVVEQIGLDQVVEFGSGADPDRHRKAAVGEVVVEGGIGDEAWHADDSPASERLQPGVDCLEVGNGVADPERVEAFQELVAGVAAGERGLALDQDPPHGLILGRIEVGVLRHGPVRRHAGVVAAQVFEGCDVHALNMGAARR
jgi:hypothetical protein